MIITMYKAKLIFSILLLSIIFSSELVFAITDSRDVKDIGIDEKLGETISGEIILKNENNETVVFKDLLSKDTPTVLNLVYYSCPKLCNFATDGLLKVVNETDSLELGKDYRLLNR